MTAPPDRAAERSTDEQEIGDLRRRNAELEAELSRHHAAGAGGTQDHYRAIFDSTVDFAIIVTDRGGLIIDWNSGAESVLGWVAAEMRGTVADCLFTAEDRAADRPGIEMRHALDTGRAADERWHLRRDGSRFWASGEMMPLRDRFGAHTGFLKILHDRTEQQKTTEVQRADAEFLRSILAASGDCIKVLDLDGRFVFMSEGGPRVMEVSDFNAVKGCPWPDLWPGERNAQARASVEAAKAGGTGRFQGFARTMAGTPRWWDVQVTPILGADGQPEKLLSVSRDITAIQQAEGALHRSEQRQRRLVETLPQLVWSCRPDGTCDYLSRQWVEYTGIPEKEQLDLAWLEQVIHPDDRDRTQAHWMGAVDGSHPYDIEYRLRRHDGIYHWFKTRGTAIRDADGAIVQWFGTCTDIQEIVEAREVLIRSREELESQVGERTRALRSADARKRAMFGATRQLIGLLDLDGTLSEINRAALDATGGIPSDVVGKPFWEAAWFSGTPGMPEVVRDALETARSGRAVRTEVALNLPDGSTRCYDFAMTPVFDDSGRVVEVVPEATDITDQRRTEDHLRQSQKMEAVGQLTGGLAHDFNNLLTGIVGSLEMMEARIAQGRIDELDRYVTAAQGAARRAAALTHRLLAFSRRQALDPKPVNVNRLVAGMEDLIRRTVGPAMETEVVGAAGLWTAMVDAGQLENALLNLCINARDAMPEGGRLTIETANKWLDERTAGERDLSPGQYLSLSVTDTGSGMPPEVAARAFDPFFTTKSIDAGTGLGLSMVYGFARQSGGQVRIYSETGPGPTRGTTVSIYIPRHHGQEETRDITAAPSAERRADGDRVVLVIDDEPTVRMLVAEVLGELGYTVIEADDGNAGLRVLQSDARIDLLVTDVGLPGGLNGRQVADAARELRPGLRVLFITGYAENAVVGNGHLDAGMQVLTKPFGTDELAARVRNLIAAGSDIVGGQAPGSP